MGPSSAAAANHIWVLLGLGLAGILLMTKKFKKTIKEDFGAFIQKLELLPPPQPAPPKAPNPLTGLTFAVSDMFDIEGYVTGFGHPDWASTHEAASRTATVVSTLVDGGAKCVGKTTIDEMAYSITGENKHYGTPTNPGAHDRLPGGPCSGAAVAVAADFVDFCVGMDATGGVRLPAGYCGVIGFKASYGAVSQSGIVPVSTSLDTIGCFAKDPSVLRRAAHVMMQLQFATQRNPRQIIMAEDCFELLQDRDRVTQPVIRSVEKVFGRQVLRNENFGAYLSSKVPSLIALSDQKMNGEAKTSTLRLLGLVMQGLLRHEFSEAHGEWINSVKADIDVRISAQHQGLEFDETDIQKLHTIRTELRLALNSLLKDDGVLVIPTFVDPPPKVGGKEMSSENYVSRLFSLLSIASLSGCCQVTVPLGYHKKLPVSVSFIARHGGDRFLLDMMQTMYPSLQEQSDVLLNSKSPSTAVSKEQSAEIAKEKGNQAFKEKQWQKAIGCYTEAIKLDGSSATYYSNRAAAFLEIGSFVQAEADCTKAIELDKKNVKAHFRRGTAREMLGFYKEAIEDFRYVLVLEPTNKRAATSLKRMKSLFQ